jgi:hypothetical protein
MASSVKKYEIIEAVITQAYPLMFHSVGNFLVQCCFEHGTPEQTIKIAKAMSYYTLTLTIDAFGCHVVQKGVDYVPENYKVAMANELLDHIPETIIHRYACHVWKKLLAVRWEGSPPRIMERINETLRGM